MSAKNKKLLPLLIICLGGGIVYILPYIQYSFYDVLKTAFGITDIQMGNLMSVLGIISAVAYLLGGVIADKFSVKWLISISLAITGFAGLWFASMPSYGELVFIMVIYGFSTVFTYWPAMIKAVKLLGTKSNQGKMFGFREAGFGLFAFIFSQAGILLIYNSTGGIEGVKNLIVYYSIIYFVAAVLSFIFIPNSKKETATGEKRSFKDLMSGVKFVMKMPALWVIGLMMFCAYCISGAGLGKLIPYWTSIMGVSEGTAASLSSVRLYLMPFICASIGGILLDKMKSATKLLTMAFIALTGSMIIFTIIPADPAMATFSIIMGFVASIFIYMMRGTYIVPMTEINIPDEYIGTAAGLCSFLGFLPDAFVFTIFGAIMGNNPGALGFKYIFIICIALSVIGLLLNILSKKLIVKQNNKLN